jgi:hypothetical protein
MSLDEELTKAQRKARKAQARAEKEANKQRKEFENAQQSISHGVNKTFITILCVRFGNKYGPHYVKRLRNMVERHITVPFEFVCLTDDPTPMEGIRSIVIKNQGYARGWWHKVHMFDPKLKLNGRILYMDLDVVICGNLDNLVSIQRNDFLGIRDFNRAFHPTWKRLNSSVMAWNHGTQSHIWEEFKTNPNNAMRLHGDQDWIWKTSHNILKFFPDEWIQSYKWEIRSKQELTLIAGKRQFKETRHDVKPHPDCCIAVFHGDPNPADVRDQFVVDNWR